MVRASRGFQVFAKPIGSLCNLDCRYCYYLRKERLYPIGESFPMRDEVLEEYIVQHIEASPDAVIGFSWHGGEPTMLGLDYFRKVVALQRKHMPRDRRVVNGIQTNGTLLNEEWCRFLAAEGFAVGVSLDGPREIHDHFRVTKSHESTFTQAMRGYRLLQKYGVYTDVLCTVNSYSVGFPLDIYRFFRQIGAGYVTFLPVVEREPNEGSVDPVSVSAEAWGMFLCRVFDEWRDHDVGRVKVQIFEEAARTAFDQEHSLCLFRPTCGDIPVIEHNGDFYSCDHFVDVDHRLGNITETPLVELLESPQQTAFGRAKLEGLPRHCLDCVVRAMCNGECPKNRFIMTPEGEPRLNYLCEGYKRFFLHCQPFVSEVASLWRRQKT